MNQYWLTYKKKYAQLTFREQVLILLTGMVVLYFTFFGLFVEDGFKAVNDAEKNIAAIQLKKLSSSNEIQRKQRVLASDPNDAIRAEIAHFEGKLAKIDTGLVSLTSGLIDPIQMRLALEKILVLQKGVSLESFELLGAQPLILLKDGSGAQSKNESGSFFDLRNYLIQLESLPWTFFWQDFNFQLKEYPTSELEVILYNLSTKKEFIGV